VIDMNETKLTTLEQVRAFLAGTVEVGFCVTGKGEDARYRHIAGVLARLGYFYFVRFPEYLTQQGCRPVFDTPDLVPTVVGDGGWQSCRSDPHPS